jgi:hypothetical protein
MLPALLLHRPLKVGIGSCNLCFSAFAHTALTRGTKRNQAEEPGRLPQDAFGQESWRHCMTGHVCDSVSLCCLSLRYKTTHKDELVQKKITPTVKCNQHKCPF